MGAFLTYALGEGDALIHIDSVDKGAACGCRCPHCQAPLYAKNGGAIREHHFAHAQGYECEGAYESQLHLLAKEVLQEVGQIMLPHTETGAFPSGLVRIRDIQVEKWDDNYHFRPDVEGVMNNGERILFEFLVSHKVSSKKRDIIINNKLKCIEIDINYQALDKEELKAFLTSTDQDRKWVVPLPPVIKKDGISFYEGRKPIYDQTRDILKGIFDDKTLVVFPLFSSLMQSFDLKQLGYDTCEIGTRYRGYKSDLLLYRSQKEDKGYIAISIRGRRRLEEPRKPNNLRVIDIVINPDLKEQYIKMHFGDGVLRNAPAVKIMYWGFHSKKH